MTRILFVCHGNICRSPMAEYIMKDLVEKAGIADRYEIASAAVSTEELGNPLYLQARQELKRHGISCEGHHARQITRQDFDHFDRIYYMDVSNGRWLKRMFPKIWESKCLPLLRRDVADPWYTGNFKATWDDLQEGCGRILEETRG